MLLFSSNSPTPPPQVSSAPQVFASNVPANCPPSVATPVPNTRSPSKQTDNGGNEPRNRMIQLSEEEMKSLFTELISEINLRVVQGQTGCKLIRYGQGYGSHHLCEATYTLPCYFYSFGIENDYSFDVDFNQKTGCAGVGLDPTVSYAKLGPHVFFLEMGHRSLEPSPESWLVTSAPELRKMFGHQRIAALKMDCEGCEYSIAKDILENDPDFFNFVDQFTIEIHVTNAFVLSHTHLHNYALLYKLLRDKGFRLAGGELTSCGAKEAPGCPEYLKRMGYPCNRDNMCQNFLFSKV